MSQISSINFKKSFIINTEHNDRTLAPTYLISNSGCEYNRNSQQARELKNQIITQAIQTYTERTGQKFQAKSYEWSAVVNLKPDSSMDDLKILAEHFNQKYGFQCYQIAIHRDEGYINEEGKKVINHHAHLEFITLDKKTGKNNYRRELITPKILREIQNEVAQILKMQRGQDNRISGAKRVEPRAYARLKEIEKIEKNILKQEILNQKIISQRLEQERTTWSNEKTHTAQEYKDIRELKNQKFQTIQELEKSILELKHKIKLQENTKEYYLDVISELKKQTSQPQKNTNSHDLEFYRQELIQTKIEKAKLFQENSNLKIALNQTQSDQKSILEPKVISPQHEDTKIDLMANYETILKENQALKFKINDLESKINDLITWVKDNMLLKIPKASNEILMRLMPLIPKSLQTKQKSQENNQTNSRSR